MAGKKFLRLVNNLVTEVLGIQTSAGAANAGDIVALDDSGRIDNSMMPVGIGADTAVIAASEALAAGDWVNVWNSTGAKVRKADATTSGKEAHGFVLAAVTSGANATVYFEGTNTQVTAQTLGLYSCRPLRARAAPRRPAHRATWCSAWAWP
ncbi:hypothetical protein [Delftia sp.]|uniref:hypothetical protein n=1 Tax=Delftia sp. TaxID=1886637 RepID=UPI00259CA22E|nr:hypothetical protein [Delftia sp.]